MRIFWLRYQKKIIWGGLSLFCVCTGVLILLLSFSRSNIASDPVLIDQPLMTQTDPNNLNITQAQAEVFEALKCAKSLQSNSSFSLDPRLNTEAQQLKQIYATVSISEQIKLLEPYDWYLVGPVFFEGEAISGCGWQNFDTNKLDIGHIERVGIALSPAESYAPASVLVLGKEK